MKILVIISFAFALIACHKQKQSVLVVKSYAFTDSCDEGCELDPATGLPTYTRYCGSHFFNAQITFLADTDRIVFQSDTFIRLPSYNIFWKFVAPHYHRSIIFRFDSVFYAVGKGGGVMCARDALYLGKEQR